VPKRSSSHKKLLPQNSFIAVQLFVLLAECIVVAVLLTAIAACISAQHDPAAFILPGALLILYLTSLSGGILSARLWDSFLWAGFVSGTVLFLLTTLLSFLPMNVAGSGLSAPAAILLRSLAIPAAVFGAWVSRKRAKHSPKHKKRRH